MKTYEKQKAKIIDGHYSCDGCVFHIGDKCTSYLESETYECIGPDDMYIFVSPKEEKK